jgi:hypothetical protein
MCKCKQTEKFNNPRLGYFDYIFLCKKSSGINRIITITNTNDNAAKALAEEKCEKEEDR